MPIYEYVCDDCGRHADVFRKVSNTEPQPCQCGETMRKLMSAPHFKFKAKREDPDKTTRRIMGLKRGERTFEDPYAKDGKIVRLADNREVAKQQIVEEVQRNRPEIKKKDINPHL
jgi:putative FmdB family regulatory protein